MIIAHHGVPVLREAVELRVVELYGRGAHAGVGAALGAALEPVGLLGEVLQLSVASLPLPSPVKMNRLAFCQLILDRRINIEISVETNLFFERIRISNLIRSQKIIESESEYSRFVQKDSNPNPNLKKYSTN